MYWAADLYYVKIHCAAKVHTKYMRFIDFSLHLCHYHKHESFKIFKLQSVEKKTAAQESFQPLTHFLLPHHECICPLLLVDYQDMLLLLLTGQFLVSLFVWRWCAAGNYGSKLLLLVYALVYTIVYFL